MTDQGPGTGRGVFEDLKEWIELVITARVPLRTSEVTRLAIRARALWAKGYELRDIKGWLEDTALMAEARLTEGSVEDPAGWLLVTSEKSLPPIDEEAQLRVRERRVIVDGPQEYSPGQPQDEDFISYAQKLRASCDAQGNPPPMNAALALSKKVGNFNEAWRLLVAEWETQGRPFPQDFDPKPLGLTPKDLA